MLPGGPAKQFIAERAGQALDLLGIIVDLGIIVGRRRRLYHAC